MRRAPAAEQRVFQVRGVSVAKHGETLCGDAWQWAAEPDAISLILVDGLGHGLQAHQAATAAIGVVAPGRSSAAVELIQQMHAGIRHTRGAAAAVARIDRRAATVTYAGIGNISASIVKSTAVRHAVSLNGTLGHEVRAFREYTYPWDQQSTIVMHSDGLGSHWALDAYPGLRQHDPLVAAALLYRDFSRERDDVTVVVGREVT
jgi:hypothetical protein